MLCVTPHYGDLDFGSDHRDVDSSMEYNQFMKPATRRSEPPLLSTVSVETRVFCHSFHVLHLLPLFMAAYIFFVLHVFVVGSSSFRFHGEPYMIFFIDIREYSVFNITLFNMLRRIRCIVQNQHDNDSTFVPRLGTILMFYSGVLYIYETGYYHARAELKLIYIIL